MSSPEHPWPPVLTHYGPDPSPEPLSDIELYEAAAAALEVDYAPIVRRKPAQKASTDANAVPGKKVGP